MMSEFVEWPKTARLNRDIVITEKIDGTNAAITIERHEFGSWLDPEIQNGDLVELAHEEHYGNGEIPQFEYHVYAQSRKRLITPEDDNYGFATWVRANAESLVRDLGPGRHFGEWWGQGIQRKYGMDHKVFSLFNTSKWNRDQFTTPSLDVVPVLYSGGFHQAQVDCALEVLRHGGSWAAGDYGVKFDNPEGICIFHTAANQVFKVTLVDDEAPKSMSAD